MINFIHRKNFFKMKLKMKIISNLKMNLFLIHFWKPIWKSIMFRLQRLRVTGNIIKNQYKNLHKNTIFGQKILHDLSHVVKNFFQINFSTRYHHDTQKSNKSVLLQKARRWLFFKIQNTFFVKKIFKILWTVNLKNYCGTS